MVLEIQLFFLLLWGPSSRKHGILPLSETHESKTTVISKTMQRIQTGLVLGGTL